MLLKLTMYLNHFLGPIVPPDDVMIKYKSSGANDGNVFVNMVHYKVIDPLLSTHLIIEYANKPNTASMITNISKNNARSDLIVNLIKDMDVPERKYLIVSDRKYQLKYIYKQLCDINLSAGLFVGGMSQNELEKVKRKKSF